MPDELARIAVGLPVASLWPLTVPYLARSRARIAVTSLLSALYILAPQVPDLSSFALLGAAVGIPLGLWSPDREEAQITEAPWKKRLAEATPLLAFLLLGLIAAALIDFDRTRDAVDEVVSSDRVALASTGLVAAVFLGGSVVAWLLRPFTKDLGTRQEASELRGLADAGRYIGWFERAVLFAFVIGGEPEAAAVALAAKSFARFPALREHQAGFAEYFLIGSLASVAVAVAVAAATRATLGIGPF
jgi:hypothetical protein